MDSDKWTDTELERLEKRIAEQYEQAQKELGEKAQEYFLQFENRFKREELAMLTTSLTKDEVETKWVDLYGSNAGFERWYKGADHAYGQTKTEAENKFKLWEMAQLGRGQHWYDMRDQMAGRLTATNIIAEGYINGKLPEIYIANNNGMAEIAKASAMSQGATGVRFDMVDEYTVRNLMMESSSVRPYKPVNISIDESSRWSKNKLQNALLQGILQGDSITHIADRFQAVTNMNRASAIRNARTACTYAQNKGKQDRLMDLKKQGCSVTKKWKATADERTRPEHWEAHLQEVDVDQHFEVGGELLMEPGDPNASGWNRYNCRCGMAKGKINFHSVLTDEEREKAGIRIIGDYVDESPVDIVKLLEQREKEEAKKRDEYIRNSKTYNYSSLSKSLQTTLNNVVNQCNNKTVTRIWNKYRDNVKFGSFNSPYGNFIEPATGKVFINLNIKQTTAYIVRAVLHEASHSIDGQASGSWINPLSYTYKNGLFEKTMRSEFDNMVNKLITENQALVDAHINDPAYLHRMGVIDKYEYMNYYFNKGWNGKKIVYTRSMAYKSIAKAVKKYSPSETTALSDALSGLSKGELVVDAYHRKEYWEKREQRLAAETFANLTSGIITNSGDDKCFRAFLPQSYAVYNEIIEQL